jgi:hypothetical protein
MRNHSRQVIRVRGGMSVFSLLSRTIGRMLQSDSFLDDGARSLQNELAREAQNLASSTSVYAVITPDGLLSFKEGTRLQAQAAADPAHMAAAGIDVVKPSGGQPGIRGYRPEAAVHLPMEYPVNPVGRHVREALAAGVWQDVPNEELRGNLVLCGDTGSTRTEVGLIPWQQQLVRVAHRAAHDASSMWAVYPVLGKKRTGMVYLPGLHRLGMSSDEARQSADRLYDVANSTDDNLSAAQRAAQQRVGQAERIEHATELLEGMRMDPLIGTLRDLLRVVSKDPDHLEVSVEVAIARLTSKADEAREQGRNLQIYPAVELLRPAVDDPQRLEAAMDSLIEHAQEDRALATALIAALNAGVRAAVRPTGAR